ncbi:MAG: hypothetical protein WD800_01275 [Dehalococcoidia bacterium]
MIKWELDTTVAEQFSELLKQAPEIVREELKAATLASLLLLENLTKDNTPVGATGLLRGAWAHELLGVTEEGVLGRVFNPLGHAAPVEYGTRPHWAPIEPLVDWVRAKLNVADESEARSIAHAIRFKIARRGTKGQKMAERAVGSAASDIDANYRAALGRAIERMGT